MNERNTTQVAGLSLLLALCASATLSAQIRPAENGRRARRISTAATPDVFGTLGAIYHWIPAAAFSPEWSETGYRVFTSDEHLYRTGGGDGWFAAPLGLEDGSFLDEIRLFFYDSDADEDVTMYLCRYYSHQDGTNNSVDCYPPIHSSGAPGYGSEPLMVGETVRLYYDVDGDGTGDEVRWIVVVGLAVENFNHSFAGARAVWHRQVSPAPLTATFNDVPTSHPFFQFVEALAASGITAGCGTGIYCPDSPLTRGQMAVFLAKALGLHWSPSFP